MIPVTIGSNSFLSMNIDEFSAWCKEINLKDEDWNFVDDGSIIGLLGPEVFFFKHEEHALLFRLKYGA